MLAGKGKKKLITIFNWGSTTQLSIDNEGVLLVNHRSWEEIREWFNILNPTNDRVIIYDTDGYLEDSLPLTRSKMRMILERFKKSLIAKRGEIDKLNS